MPKNEIDYAPYYLEAKKKLNEVHTLLVKQDYIQAASLVNEIIVELRMMQVAVKSHME
jgi:hypothetical protein